MIDQSRPPKPTQLDKDEAAVESTISGGWMGVSIDVIPPSDENTPPGALVGYVRIGLRQLAPTYRGGGFTEFLFLSDKDCDNLIEMIAAARS